MVGDAQARLEPKYIGVESERIDRRSIDFARDDLSDGGRDIVEHGYDRDESELAGRRVEHSDTDDDFDFHWIGDIEPRAVGFDDFNRKHDFDFNRGDFIANQSFIW